MKFEGGRSEDLPSGAATASWASDGRTAPCWRRRCAERTAPEAVEHAHEKCIEALDRIPRATRLALLQWCLAPALRDIVRIRYVLSHEPAADDGGLDFSGFARTHQLALRVFLCVAALGRIDWDSSQ